MSKSDRPLKMTSVVLDEENPDGLEQALRILIRLAAKKHLREQGLVNPLTPPTEPPKTMGGRDSEAFDGRKLLDIDGLSRYLSMPKATIYTWVSTRKIPVDAVVRLGRALRFDRAAIDRWVESSRGVK